MKKPFIRRFPTSLPVSLFVLFLIATFSLLSTLPQGDEQEARVMRVPTLTTTAWAVFDPQTGEVLRGDNLDTERPIASLTKLFTAYMVLYTDSGAITTTITESDIETHGDFGKLRYGEKRTLSSLLFPLLIESSNDAGAAISRTLGPLYPYAVQGIVDMLGLTHTHIVDATGLSPENVSTPRNLALFFAKVKAHYPHITDITKLKLYVTDTAGLVNNNPARNIATFVSGKQGYIPEAGKTFVGTFAYPDRDHEIGIVLLNSTDLIKDIDAILDTL